MPSKGGQKEAPAPSAPSTPSAPAAAWESESVKTLRAAVEQQSTLLESMADRIAALSASRAEQQPPSPGHAVPPQAEGSTPTPSAAARAAVQEGGDQGAGGDALAGGNTPAAAPINERAAPAISPDDEAEGEDHREGQEELGRPPRRAPPARAAPGAGPRLRAAARRRPRPPLPR